MPDKSKIVYLSVYQMYSSMPGMERAFNLSSVDATPQ